MDFYSPMHEFLKLDSCFLPTDEECFSCEPNESLASPSSSSLYATFLGPYPVATTLMTTPNHEFLSLGNTDVPLSLLYAGDISSCFFPDMRPRGNAKKQPMESQPTGLQTATHKCDHPGCQKAFRRIEHLKRHRQTFHSQGSNRFSSEFCGKDQFSRRDNLDTHRRLHARPNRRSRGVPFIPAAVPIINEEERSRKRRKGKTRNRRRAGR